MKAYIYDQYGIVLQHTVVYPPEGHHYEFELKFESDVFISLCVPIIINDTEFLTPVKFGAFQLINACLLPYKQL